MAGGVQNIRTIQVSLGANISNFVSGMNAATRTLTGVTAEMRNNLAMITTNTDLMLARLRNTGTVAQQNAVRLDAVNQRLQIQREYINRLNSELQTARQRFGSVSTEVRNLERELLGAATTEQRLINQQRELNRQLSIRGQFSNFGNTVANSGMIGLGAGALMASGIGQAASKGIEYNSFMEAQQTGFKVLTGDATKAADLLDKLKKMAIVTPFETKDLSAQSRILMQYGIELDNVIPLMQMLGDVSLGDKEKLKSLTYAFAQIYARGKLTGDNLRQLTEAGFNPLQNIAQSTGKQMSDLVKDMENGEISVRAVAQALQDATSKGGRFYKGMEEYSKTFAGQLSTLRENIDIVLGALTKPLFELLTKAIIPILNNMTSFIARFAEAHPQIAAFTNAIAAATLGLTVFLTVSGAIARLLPVLQSGFALLVTIFAKLRTGSLALAAALGLTRWQLVAVLGLVAIWATAATLVISAWENVKVFFMSLWDTVKAVASSISAALKFAFYSAAATASGSVDTLLNSLSRIPGMKGLYVGVSGRTSGLTADAAAAGNELADATKNLSVETGYLKDNTIGMLNVMKANAGELWDSIKNIFTIPEVPGPADLKEFNNFGQLNLENFDNLGKTANAAEDSSKKVESALKSFVDKVKTQAERFRDALGLFDKATTEKISGERLLVRLRSQLSVYEKWTANIASLKARLGEGSNLFQALLGMGPKAAGEVAGLSRLDDFVLKEYEMLYGRKNSLAYDAAGAFVAQESKQEKKVEQVVINLNGGVMIDNMDVLVQRITQQLKLQGVI